MDNLISRAHCYGVISPKIQGPHFKFVSHFIVGLSDSMFEFHISTFEFTTLHSSFTILHSSFTILNSTFALRQALGSATAHSLFNVQVFTFYVCLITLCMFYFSTSDMYE